MVLIPTGAPGMLYLGSKSLSVLNKLAIIKEVAPSNSFHYRVNSKLCYGRTTLSEVYASEVPNIIESIGSEVWDDIHCNILGLPGIAMKVREV